MNRFKSSVALGCLAVCLGGPAWSADTTLGTKVDDAALTTRVKAALIVNPDTKARQIDVDTNNGVVTLSGTVDSQAAKTSAESAAKSIAGVSSVENHLMVSGNMSASTASPGGASAGSTAAAGSTMPSTSSSGASGVTGAGSAVDHTPPTTASTAPSASSPYGAPGSTSSSEARESHGSSMAKAGGSPATSGSGTASAGSSTRRSSDETVVAEATTPSGSASGSSTESTAGSSSGLTGTYSSSGSASGSNRVSAAGNTGSRSAAGDDMDTRIQQALKADPRTMNMNVEVRNGSGHGAVILSGTASNNEERSAAAEVARGVSGVDKVDNRITVKGSTSSRGSDRSSTDTTSGSASGSTTEGR